MAHFRLKDAVHENRLFRQRILTSAAVVLALTLALVARLVYLQIFGHEHYAMLARDNRVKIAPLPPTRGLIYDRHGRILAENVPVYSLEIVPEQVEDMEATLARLQRLLTVTPEEVTRFRQQLRRHRRFDSIPLKLHLSDDEVARFAARRPFFHGVDIHARLVRHYPYGELTSHVVGYVGSIDERELKRLDPTEYRGTTHIGKVGIERAYEGLLHGHTGYAEIETNARGRDLRVLREVTPRPGADLHLGLDIDLQRLAYEGLGEHNGAVVAIEPASGQVLALVSKPGFDPNAFVYGIHRQEYQALQRSPDRPLFDRTLRGRYPPGSTIKPFVGLAGLEYGVIDARREIFCPGYYQLPGVSHRYRDWKKWGHGQIDLKDAIAQSCDVYFYDLAHNLGIDRLHDFLDRFGFGRRTGIDLVGEKAGLLPSRDWKRKVFHQPWYPGETLIAGIGQGFLQVTPLQLARAVATLANRGRLVRPHVAAYQVSGERSVPLFPDPDEGRVALAPRHLRTIVDAMIAVVHGPRGTARRIAKDLDFLIAGKTGTAQVFTVKQDEEYRASKLARELHDHALFIAFAPVDHPKIAVAVIAEHAGHGGSVAAPIARRIILHHLRQP
ncbi:penicillin-binding protein 2 [Methylomarinovum tepidoasis]|uniref:Peptidoglycan D,D-transpeptidase MrdA n=1 Tax=Methylomarinovum tepidoasis TaxID=2840183 RepID=A0AAU9C4L2_9GAMM|nr:penicillin-binding protein 2 [Methylomarinovum sp. IN45]BCX88069.1 penicillin-binding protein 2 [Methylomarinovum sp. IN45]